MQYISPYLFIFFTEIESYLYPKILCEVIVANYTTALVSSSDVDLILCP